MESTELLFLHLRKRSAFAENWWKSSANQHLQKYTYNNNSRTASDVLKKVIVNKITVQFMNIASGLNLSQ